MVVEESGEVVSEAPCLIGGPLNPRGQNTTIEISKYIKTHLFIYSYTDLAAKATQYFYL